jgi:hypothetical protein
MATHQRTTYTFTCDLCGEEKTKEELTPVQFRKGHPPARPAPLVSPPPLPPPGIAARAPRAETTTQRAAVARPISHWGALRDRPEHDLGRSSGPPVIDICQQCAGRPISDLLAYNGSPVPRNDTGDGPQEQPRG